MRMISKIVLMFLPFYKGLTEILHLLSSDGRDAQPKRQDVWLRASRVIGRSASETFGPRIDIFFGLILGESIALLDFAYELIALALNHVDFIVRELAPFLFRLSFKLFPLP